MRWSYVQKPPFSILKKVSAPITFGEYSLRRLLLSLFWVYDILERDLFRSYNKHNATRVRTRLLWCLSAAHYPLLNRDSPPFFLLPQHCMCRTAEQMKIDYKKSEDIENIIWPELAFLLIKNDHGLVVKVRLKYLLRWLSYQGRGQLITKKAWVRDLIHSFID